MLTSKQKMGARKTGKQNRVGGKPRPNSTARGRAGVRGVGHGPGLRRRLQWEAEAANSDFSEGGI